MDKSLSLVVLLLIILCRVSCVNSQYIYRAQPRIQTQNGNLILVSAENKNISLKTVGSQSYINFNGENLIMLVHMAKNASALIEGLRAGELATLQQNVDTLNQGTRTVQQRLLAVEALAANRSASQPRVKSMFRRLITLSSKVFRLERMVRRMSNLLKKNECASNPCHNGGICEDGYNKFICRCPSNWEGESCTVDVNECARFIGTDLGCQHGATCVNRPGSYDCLCASEWFGLHCTQKQNDCASANAQELCGHGVCLPQRRGGGRAFTCLCDQGWNPDPMTGACIVDENECAGLKMSACSKSPPVPCINTQGSFLCGSCPEGYTGNGYYCNDIDECLTNNGGCSLNPMVQCINTQGSRVCGGCPAGYEGDGKSCTMRGLCQLNNGGCHPLASCYENRNIGQSYVQCTCPMGYAGNGIGYTGCVISAGATTNISMVQIMCNPSPCEHGTCTPISSDRFTCLCYPGYMGTLCEHRVTNPCSSNPCLNNGTCIEQNGLFTCVCANGYRGLRCENQGSACGSQIRQDSGELTFPLPGSNNEYARNANCLWLIRTNNSKVLNITFTSFQISSSTSCRNSWLQLHDGPRAHSPLIGTYCGSSLPPNIISTYGAVVLWYHVTNTGQQVSSFALKWNSTNPVCGGTLDQAQFGSISSPGSPAKYPKNRDCIWNIRVTPGRRIQMHFSTLMLESNENCNYDFIKVYDGRFQTDPLIRQFCNTSQPPPFLSSGHEVLVHFHSDNKSSDYGFHMTYSAAAGVPGCGGVWTSPNGEFTSPNFPRHYSGSLHCEYLIQLPFKEKITLKFEAFELESSGRCIFDYIELREGSSMSSPLAGRFCGDDGPAPYKSQGNELLIIFHTDVTVPAKGFKAIYETACGGVFTSESGKIESPNYPNPYPKRKVCIYEIALPVGKAVKLQFEDMSLEVHESCAYDAVEIRDGDSEQSKLVGVYCGQNGRLPPITISTFNYLWIKFRTDDSVHQNGFLANYTSIDTRCGGILRNASGVIITPPRMTMECIWVISVTSGNAIRLLWTRFNFGTSDRIFSENEVCQMGSVKVFDNSTGSESGVLIGNFCGSNLPPTLTSLGNLITVIINPFTLDDSFEASYESLSTSQLCGGTYYHTNGVLKSPNYPFDYPNNLECVWIIEVPLGQQIRLDVTNFTLENSYVCSFDYLEIRNGGAATSPLIGQFCGSTIPKTIPSYTNQLYVKFKTDDSFSMTGFSINWDGTSTGCGGIISSPSGSIHSPNYPNSYAANSECFWKIAVNRGSAIRLFILDMDLELGARACQFDYLEIRDGPSSTSPLLGRFCHHDGAPIIISQQNYLWLKFRSDVSLQGRGFSLRYETLCRLKLRDYRGVIESPNFPQPYPHNRNCSWVISAPSGNKINVTFTHFELENPFNGNCSYDFLELKQGSDDRAPVSSLGKFCGDTKPNGIITSQLNSVYVNFETDNSVPASGFRLEWIVHGCGGIFDAPRGELKTPNYPQAYPPFTDCQWIINVAWDSSVELTIHEVDIEQSSHCDFDYLKVWGGPSVSSPLLATLCHSGTNPKVFTSSGRTMQVTLHTDGTVFGRGFSASYRSVPSQCGGKMTSNTGSIHSKNYPQTYDSNDDCSWLIEVDKNYVASLIFTSFDVLSSEPNCTSGFVKVHDGPNDTYPVLLQHCGNTNPPAIKATANQIYVRMKADSSKEITGKGFIANYTMSCGARILTDGVGELHSVDTVNFTNSEPLNCTWTIIADKPDAHVTLTITHLDIFVFTSNTNECGVDRIEVRDGDGLDAPLIGIYCGFQIPAHITSRGSAITLNMITMRGMLHNSLSATYSVLTDACGGRLTAAEGSFANPGYPLTYPTSIECVWTINTSPGNKVLLTFGMFDIEKTDNCNGDYLEIRAGLNGSDPLIGVYCGNEIPNNLTASTKLWIKFHSDNEGVAPGFVAFYSLVHGGELTGPSGTITSPMYPKPYIQHGDIWWRITVQFGFAIRIVFKEFFLDTMRCLSSIHIYDGFDDTARELYEGCEATSIPEAIESTNTVVYIKLNNQPIRYGSIFRLEWLQVQRNVGRRQIFIPTPSTIPGCGGIYSNFSANNTIDFTSPGYPHGYANNLDCTWIFEAPPTLHIAVVFNVMNLEPSFECRFDYVAVYRGIQGTDQWSLKGKYCHPNVTNIHGGIHGSNLLKVEFHTDVLNNRTGFAASATAVCGSSLQGPNGVIDVFNVTRPSAVFGFLQACEYNITVRPGRTIKVTFEFINLPNNLHPSCADVYILLKNGGGPDSPHLGDGKYCGQSIPEIPQTTGNKLYIKYSGIRGATYGFRLRYEEVSTNCGGQFYVTEVSSLKTISSPNYPRVPPSNTECEWVFVAPQGHRLRMDFSDRIDFSYSRNCEKAYVEVNDGGSQLSPQIGRYCREPPSSIKSTDNALYVHYYTESNDPKTGFQANISIAKCGGTIRAEGGVIESPEIIDQSRLACEWKIIAPASNLLSFTFDSISIQPSASSGSCLNTDVIEITEKISFNRTESVLGRFCGTENPTTEIQSSSDQVILKFNTSRGSGRTSGNNFKIRFASTLQRCGGIFNTPEGEIISPGYPSIQRRRRICAWVIEVPKGRRIRLQFLDFDLEGSHPVCPQWLGVYNGAQTLPLGLFCGSDNPSVIESSSSKMILQSLAWHSSGHRGFRLKYTSDQPSVCEGNLDGNSGFLSFPRTNLTSIYCEWERNNITGNTFAMTILNATIKTLPDIPCLQSPRSLTFTSGARLLGKICNDFKPPKVIANPFGPTSVAAIQGEVDSAVHFTLEYKVHNCGGILKGPMEEITSPNFPQEYNASIDCAWSLQYPPGQTIQLNFITIDLEPECDHDYIAVYNGPTAMSPLIKVLCGNSLPTTIRSQSSYLFITFHSDAQHQYSGFKITAEPVISGCGGIFHQKKGFIMSPNFPNDYPNNAECEWEIRVDTGYHIGLQFMGRFHLETSDGCVNDFVEVFNYANDAWISLGKLCGRELPRAFNSTGNVMKVLFRSNSSMVGDGFKALWNVNCGGIITAPKGVIISPSYPENYGKSLYCNYTLSAPGRVITYEFVDFSLEQGFQDCRYDNVTLYRNLGRGRHSRILPISMIFSSTHCGQEAPPSGWSPNSLSIVFQTDKWIERRGFRMNYEFESCGGEINQSGIIESPKNMILQGQNPKLNCTWILTAPKDKAVTLRIENFVVEGSYQCHFGFVEAFEGNTINSSKTFGKLCGNLTNRFRVIKSRTNQMVLTFYTEGMFRRSSRFSAVVSFTSGEAAGCGGLVNVSRTGTKTISSIPINAASYESMLDCQWLVQTLPGQILQLRFESMGIKDCNNSISLNETISPCSCDYLEVFDGRGQFSELIGRYCGTQSPGVITSSSNSMWVRFVTDDSDSGPGFDGTISSLPLPCGPTTLTVTNVTQVLTSPSYPTTYPRNLRCKWHLTSREVKRFDIHLVDLDVELSLGCAKDKLEMVDSTYSETFNEGFGETFMYTGPPRTAGTFMFQYSPARTATHKSTFCGVGKQMDYYSITNNVDISFISDSLGSGKGFKLEYKFAGCSRNYTRRQGRILDQWEQRDFECLINIQTEANRTIALYFTEVFMLSTSNCTQSGLEIRDGLTSRSQILGKVCGFSVPRPIFSTGSSLSLRAWSSSNWYKEHYDITYTTTDQGRGCGGQIFNVAGSITSPLYPSNVRELSQCTWDITVPEGSVVQIQFQVFNIGPSSTCDTDYIKLFDIHPITGNKVLKTRLCGEDSPAVYKGDTNGASIQYVTSVHNAGSGWSLNFAAYKKGQ